MKTRRAITSRVAAGINITPLIDILLVLLVIFMVTSKDQTPPRTPTALDTEVPQPSVKPPVNSEPVLIVSVDQTGAIQVNGAYLDGAPLKIHLESVFRSRRDRTIFVKADPSLRFEDVAQVIDESRGAGAQHIGLMTQ
jgi:biopolymer transport protein ExbD